MALFSELKRRNIFRVGLLYILLAWLIRDVGELLVQLLGMPDWIYRFICALLVIGFPLCLVFSWIYEITPEGLKREFEVDRAASITHQTGRRILRAAIYGLVAIIAVNLVKLLLK